MSQKSKVTQVLKPTAAGVYADPVDVPPWANTASVQLRVTGVEAGKPATATVEVEAGNDDAPDAFEAFPTGMIDPPAAKALPGMVWMIDVSSVDRVRVVTVTAQAGVEVVITWCFREGR
ncbi:MAG TPA: hypothetical protein VFF65_07580 [Phycisphaerales bacterium]|nr:hypothetical protein [Phycisphaerales bacterium]